MRNRHVLHPEYRQNTTLGAHFHRLQIDVDQVGTLSGEVIPSALRMVTVFTLVMTTMLVLNYRLTAIVLPLIPVFILVRWRFHDRLRQGSYSGQKQSRKMVCVLAKTLSSIFQVRLLFCDQRRAD